MASHDHKVHTYSPVVLPHNNDDGDDDDVPVVAMTMSILSIILFIINIYQGNINYNYFNYITV